MKNYKSLLATLLVGITCALIGHCLAGCDGSGGSGIEQPDSGAAGSAGQVGTGGGTGGAAGAAGQVGTGGAAGAAGQVGTGGSVATRCNIPSPTGDQPGPYGAQARLTPNYVVVKKDSVSECRAYVSLVLSNGASSGFYTADQLKAYAGIDCADVAHDFQGTSGQAWCLGVGSQTKGCQVIDGTIQCGLVVYDLYGGVGPMQTVPANIHHAAYLNRSWAVCSESGVFQGWSCT